MNVSLMVFDFFWALRFRDFNFELFVLGMRRNCVSLQILSKITDYNEYKKLQLLDTMLSNDYRPTFLSSFSVIFVITNDTWVDMCKPYFLYNRIPNDEWGLYIYTFFLSLAVNLYFLLNFFLIFYCGVKSFFLTLLCLDQYFIILIKNELD